MGVPRSPWDGDALLPDSSGLELTRSRIPSGPWSGGHHRCRPPLTRRPRPARQLHEAVQDPSPAAIAASRGAARALPEPVPGRGRRRHGPSAA